jgi:hypothetical protein
MRAFDQSGANSSVAYSGTVFPLEITVFVYPRTVVPGGSIEDHFRAALADIFHFHPRARLESSGSIEVPFSSERTNGLSAFLTFIHQGRDLESWLLVVAEVDNIVKVRATYERPEDGPTAGSRMRESLAAVQYILQAIHRETPGVPNNTVQATAQGAAPDR